MKKIALLIIMTAFCWQFSEAQKPNSKFGGVQIGAITYSFRSMPDQTLEGILNYTVQAGLSSIELMGGAVEQYAGVPEDRDEAREWRTTVSMDKFKEIKKMFETKGVKIHILKLGDARWSDEEIDYAFVTAKAMGAKAVTEEIGLDAAKRLAPFAEKHGMYIAFHNHMQYAEEGFSADPILAVSPAVMLNFDAGHYFGSTGLNPCDFIKKYHDRIYSIHIKDKTGPQTEPANENQVWGQGEAPLAELLLLMKKERWPICLDIELEYYIANWSNQVKETKTCVQYARNILI